MKIEDERKRRVMNVKKEHQQKVEGEDHLRQNKEEEVMQMEKLEMELIKKL